MGRKFVTIKEATEIVGGHGPPITTMTMINWTKRYGLGHKVGGRWQVDETKLREFLSKHSKIEEVRRVYFDGRTPEA